MAAQCNEGACGWGGALMRSCLNPRFDKAKKGLAHVGLTKKGWRMLAWRMLA